MTEIARCCCGSLRANTTGTPWIVAICHCTECQRRTGSAFGASAHFARDQVHIEGASKVYIRRGDSGRSVQFHFCPDCGTTVFWYAESRPDHVGIALGAFADVSMPSPAASIWEATRHPWVIFDHPIERFGDQGLTPVTSAQDGTVTGRAK